jgi:predicted membrane channel-forming protein YqfA (hemolysin III family)
MAAIVKAKDLPQGFHAYEYTLTGYRVYYSPTKALLSLFDTRHNEFWMIWSEIFPCLYFCMCYANYLRSNWCCCVWTTHALYFGLITSRVCSAIYHIFNCVSTQMHNRLIYLDFIGISNMAITTPVFYLNIVGHNEYYHVYITSIASVYLFSLSIFVYSMMYNVDIDKSIAYCQGLLVFMAIMTCTPMMIVGIDMQLCRYYISVACLATGFLIYCARLPERLMKLGAADGKIWNSHVLWHCFVSVAQYYYIQ